MIIRYMDVTWERQKIDGEESLEKEKERDRERERKIQRKHNVGQYCKVLVMKLKSISKESAQNFKYGIDNVAN